MSIALEDPSSLRGRDILAELKSMKSKVLVLSVRLTLHFEEVLILIAVEKKAMSIK